MSAWVCHDAGPERNFVAFDCDQLSDESISDLDIRPIRVDKSSKEASETWSSGCAWYFSAREYGIVLARPGAETGVICLKRSWRFLEAFIEAPIGKARKAGTR